MWGLQRKCWPSGWSDWTGPQQSKNRLKEGRGRLVGVAAALPRLSCLPWSLPTSPGRVHLRRRRDVVWCFVYTSADGLMDGQWHRTTLNIRSREAKVQRGTARRLRQVFHPLKQLQVSRLGTSIPAMELRIRKNYTNMDPGMSWIDGGRGALLGLHCQTACRCR